MKLELPASLWPLVHALAAGEAWPPSSERAVDCFLAEAEREGLLPLVFAAAPRPPLVEQGLLRRRAVERLYARRAATYLEARTSLARLLGGEPVVLLKGSDYAHRLYPSPELRPMADIDLLVPRERIDAVCERLVGAGCVRRFPGGASTRLASYHERVFLLGEIPVEVHHGFVQGIRHRIDYRAVWERRVGLDGVGAVSRLGDVDALAYHALSLAKDEFSVPLVRYVDLWLMLEQSPALLGPASERAREWGALRAFYGTLQQALGFFPELRTPERQALLERLLPPGARRFLDRWVLPAAGRRGSVKRGGRGLQVWRKLCLLDDPWRRAGFGVYQGYALLAGRWLEWRESSKPS